MSCTVLLLLYHLNPQICHTRVLWSRKRPIQNAEMFVFWQKLLDLNLKKHPCTWHNGLQKLLVYRESGNTPPPKDSLFTERNPKTSAGTHLRACSQA